MFFINPKRFKYSLILLREFTITDFKLRYQGSVLGYMWSLLRPLSMFVILYIVFANFLKIGSDIENYSVYLLFGIVIWTFFNEVTTGNIAGIVSRGNLIRKIDFPKYVIILSGTTSALINLAFNILVVSVFLIFADPNIGWSILWLLPLFIELALFSIAIAMLLSALYVRFRDMTYIWEVVLQAGFYATPILYPLSFVPEKAAKILMLNPLAQIIQDARHVLVTPQSQTVGMLYNNELIRLVPVGIVLLFVLIGFGYFKKHSASFAENV